MAKLDWTKASQAAPDPARVQRVNDFVEPDPVIIRVTNLTREEKKQLAAKQRNRGKLRSNKKVTAKAKAQPAKSKETLKKPKLTDEEKLLAAEARAKQKAEHHQRYLAKALRQREAMEAKKKSHLQVWAEKLPGLGDDRETLHQTWRADLLPV